MWYHIKNIWDFENNEPLQAIEIAQRLKLDQMDVKAIETMIEMCKIELATRGRSIHLVNLE